MPNIDENIIESLQAFVDLQTDCISYTYWTGTWVLRQLTVNEKKILRNTKYNQQSRILLLSI